jgi:glycosyltransferase involved in cell wall biosynthesis
MTRLDPLTLAAPGARTGRGPAPPARPYLCLVTGGFGRPHRAALRELERQDRYPRTTYFEDVVGADVVDEEFLEARGALERRALSRLPLVGRQVLVAYALRRRYRAIISWGERPGLALAALLKATRARTPHVGLFSWISKPPKNRLLQRLHSHLDRIVLWSRYQRDVAVSLLGVPAEKIALVSWWVDDRFFRPMPAVGDTGIAAVGREMRDYPTLLRALDGVDVPCHIAAATARRVQGPAMGDGPLPPTVTVGRKDYRELRELYARSRFVVVPIDPSSDTDNGITVTLEAFAMGKPVIISRTVAQSDVVRDGETGLYVPPGDPRALREAILALWADPARCRAMGAAARAHVVREHRLEDFVTRVAAVTAEAARNRVLAAA